MTSVDIPSPISSLKECSKCGLMRIIKYLLVSTIVFFLSSSNTYADNHSDFKTYERISKAVTKGETGFINQLLSAQKQDLDWESATDVEMVGNLRIIGQKHTDDKSDKRGIYLIRKLSGELYILVVPDTLNNMSSEKDSPYAGLDEAFESKMHFQVKTLQKTVGGESYNFALLVDKPQQVLLDQIFKASIILMLFFVMVGMGMTLTIKDFLLVFTKPRGILIGQLLQFGFMPFLAMVFGHLLGFYEVYPFIFVGLILITATPGGVTSNLMTYYAKGDLALSISLTSFSTVLSLLFTPLLLALYCSDMPEIIIPVKVVVQTILILVIIPLALGMLFRGKWQKAAEKLIPFFSALGIIALLFLIIAGVLSNLHAFADIQRYGVKFYLTVFSITLLGMMFGILFSKLGGINNFQTRAISLETGLRNSALAMTLALLIQDTMGDFFSSMFVTSGIFGLIMYLAGIISIFIFKRTLPVDMEEQQAGEKEALGTS